MRQQAHQETQPGGKKPAKNKPSGPAQLKPVALQSALVLKGGHLRKPMTMDTFTFEGQAFVKLTKREAWLCQVAAGKARGLDPLSRTTLMDDLAASLRSGSRADASASAPAAAKADPMRALGLDEAVTDEAMLTGLRYVGKKKPKAAKPQIVKVAPPASASRVSGGPSQVSLLTRAPGGAALRQGVLLHVDHVPWAVEVLLLQVKEGGVTFVPPESRLREPWFALGESTWRCRAMAPNGDVLRKRIKVPLVLEEVASGSKRMLTRVEYQKLKKEKLGEILAWREHVQQGFSD